MTMWICFCIAMVVGYVIQLGIRGFDAVSTISFLIMFVIVGAHIFFTTRKKAIWGIVVPLFILISFYPVYKLIEPRGTVLVSLVGLYVITLGMLLFVWYKARQNKD